MRTSLVQAIMISDSPISHVQVSLHDLTKQHRSCGSAANTHLSVVFVDVRWVASHFSWAGQLRQVSVK